MLFSPAITGTDPENARPGKKNWPRKKKWQVGRDNDSRLRRPRTAAPGLARGRMVPSCSTCGATWGPTRCSRARADPGGPTLLPPGAAAPEQGLRLQPAPQTQRLHPAKLVRSLQGGERRLTKLGKGFFRDKYYKFLVHVPVIIRGRRRSGRNAGATSAGTGCR